MTNIQLLIAVGLPLIVILIGIVLQQLSDTRIVTRIAAIETRLLVIEGDLRQFYQTLGRHEKAIEIIEKKLER